MIINDMIYYDSRTWREKTQERYLLLVDILKNSNVFNAVAEHSVKNSVPETDADIALQFYNFKFGNSRIIQVSPYTTSTTGSIRMSVLRGNVPTNEPYNSSNNFASNLLSMPSSSTTGGTALKIIINDLAFALYGGTTQIFLAYKCKHILSGQGATVTQSRIPLFDDTITTSRNGTTDTHLNVGFRTLRPSAALMPNADVITAFPVSVTSGSENFGFTGYLTEGMLFTTNVNGFPAHSLVQVSGARYYLVSTEQMIPVD